MNTASIRQKNNLFVLEYNEGKQNKVVISENLDLILLEVKDKCLKLILHTNDNR